ncbi:MAG: penicillin acylase family protein [Myxococcota bacterium]
MLNWFRNHALCSTESDLGKSRRRSRDRGLRWVVLFSSLLFAACGDDSAGPAGDFSARIVRTPFGVPHVVADDYGGLGYGAGYAYAQDNFCVLMREVIAANGESARWFGEEEGDLSKDYVFTFFANDAFIEDEFLAGASDEVRQLARGYAAGVNRYLGETGVDNLAEGPEGCRGEDWVREISEIDLGKVYWKLTVLAGIDATDQLISAADDVAPAQSLASAIGVPLESQSVNWAALDFTARDGIGSNAYAIGAEGSQTGAGLLLGNSHQPWQGPGRWYVQHLTIPGEYDVYGSSLQGVPLVNIGFNEDMAWGHTVSTAQRFGLFELALVEGSPFEYLYDGEVRQIEVHPVTVGVRLEDGSVEERTKNLYTSQFGPIVDLTALSPLAGGWPTVTGTVFALRDANLDNSRVLDQFKDMGQSRSVDELEDAVRSLGLPWVNTIAADREGEALYGDLGAVPNVTQELMDECATSLLSAAITSQGLAALDGSRSDCEWGSDDDAPPGLLGFSQLPLLRTGPGVEYVSNSNDSYWLSNPNSLLEGFSPIFARNGFDPPERIEQSLRTRQGFVQAEERIAGTDGLGAPGFNIDVLREIMYQNRNIAGELARDGVVEICDAVEDWSSGSCGEEGAPYSENPDQAARACGLLEDWDGLFNVESVGAAIWRTTWFPIGRTEDLWLVPFDPNDPVSTPRTLNVSNPEVVEAVRCAVGGGVDFLIAGGIPIDSPWGDVQFRFNGDRSERIPIHGGASGFMWSSINANFVEGEGYSDIRQGNTYIQAVTFDETPCPVAFGVVTHSQSTDPASPHYSDWTEVYSSKSWTALSFCAADVEANKVSEIEISTDD